MVKKNIWVSVLFCLNIHTGSFCQEGPVLLKKAADSLFSSNQFELAQEHYEKAIEQFKLQKQYDSLVVCVNDMVYNLVSLRRIEELPDRIEKELSYFKQINLVDSIQLAKTYSWLAYAYRRNFNFKNALNAYGDAITIFERIEANLPGLAYAYFQAAQIYMRYLDYEKSIDYLNKALKSDSTKQFNASIYTQIAHNNFFLGNYELVFDNIDRASLLIKTPRELAILNNILGGTNLGLGLNKEAIKNYKDALHFFSKFNPYWQQQIDAWKGLAVAYAAIQEKDSISFCYHKAIKILNGYGPSKSRIGASLYTAIGDFHQNQEEDGQALRFYQKALAQVIPNLDSTDIQAVPTPQALYPEAWIMTASHNKAKTLLKRYKKSQNLGDLELAARCSEIALVEIDLLKSTYGSEKARLYIGGYGRTHFEQAIEIQYLLYAAKQEEEHLVELFRLIEHSKAALFRQALQRNRAAIVAAIPDAYLEKEQQLRLGQADAAKSLVQEQLKGERHDSVKVEELKQELLDREEAYSAYLKKLQRQFPEYENLTVNTNTSSLEAIQATIASSSGSSILLSYFWGVDHLYLMAVSTKAVKILRLAKTEEHQAALDNFLPFINQKQPYSNNPIAFYDLAYKQYQMLGLDEVLMEGDWERLILIPDGPLHYLSFEALLTQPSNGTEKIPPYLLQQYAIDYHFTAATLEGSSKQINSNNQLLAVVPQFGQGERGLVPLDYGMEETRSASFSRLLQAEMASAAEFLKFAPEYTFLHLSTHAEANPKSASARIEFIDRALLLPEIYAMNLQADLVVLSACETGTGKLEGGEGLMSLARGFSFAGAKSLISSLWKVNEKSTATIFANFYEELAAGADKSSALRKAKLAYLNTVESDAKKAPYYWAGFIFYGKDGPANIKKPINWTIVLPGLLGLLALTMVVYRFWGRSAFTS